MTTYDQFCAAAKMRHDYSDMILVRYTVDGENYDTWVSGTEAVRRLKSEKREQQLKAISQLDWEEVKDLRDAMPDQLKEKGRRSVKDFLADQIEENIGGNVIGDSIADNIRGSDSRIDPRDREKEEWQHRLRQPPFRQMILQLAWINLRGSLPDTKQEDSYDDWV